MNALQQLVTAGWFQVFMVFLLPWGPGALAGMILAQTNGLPPVTTIGLYVLSDVVTAAIFEPLAQQIRARGSQSMFGRIFLANVEQMGSMTQFGSGRFSGPISLFVFTFLTDFFTAAIVSTGLSLARLVAWATIIAGDVLWFLIIFLGMIVLFAATDAASFLSHNNLAFLAVMTVVAFTLPPLVRRLLGRRQAPAPGPR